MKKVILYIILIGIVAVIGFFVWFFVFYLQVPALKIPKDASQTERVTQIDKWLEQLHTDRKFNGGVLITKEGIPLLAKTYGFTNVSRNIKLTNKSSFRLASVSKQFTASGIMLLKERKQLDYDDLVSTYIPEFPYKRVTIRHLLNQTSGVPDAYMSLAEKNKDSIDILTNQIAINLLVQNHPKVNFEPNEKYQYSNTNYILLARIIEIISNQSFEDFMSERIFTPLGMKNTRVWNLLSKDTTFKHKTDGFEDMAGEVREIKPTFIDGVAGDGAVFSSIEDFVIWDQFWYQNDLISEENLKEAFKKPTLNNGKKSNYGFGWVILSEDTVMHNGVWLAANSYFVRNTKKKTSFVLLDNSSNLFFNKIIKNLK
ncbi:beta-lactamase family protein [Aquimarina sp. MMG015]|uniref:serine hydrolase domain-containing protein n=1 Tax=unclassified Aquimarina TaxID=2627091 RepID=UPI000E47EB67|nr:MULTISPECIES: serine hydrolase domain-containing protein [unclassified Aquimarina]AXT54259.1 class A beta-lactamase-related serine hydrolase [Aquimarina sp. AD1]MBQ4804206.1 beta-lactamase family protein [Aquimarina sp. MMG015]RKN16824.1 class A beta-lactamase-related serine hydrolase [Aquimarina sp. AD1]